MENSKKINNHWDKIAYSYYKVLSISEAHIKRTEEVVNLVLQLNPQKILDLGCGNGILEKKMIESGFKGKITAVDNSKKMIEIANFLKDRNEIDFKILNLNNNFPFERNYFDCVIAINVIYLLERPKQFFLEVKKVLKNQGHFIMVNPKPGGSCTDFLKAYFQSYSISELMRKIFLALSNFRHIVAIASFQKKLDRLFFKEIIRYHTPEEIEKLSKNAGFKIKLVKEVLINQNWLFILEALNSKGKK